MTGAGISIEAPAGRETALNAALGLSVLGWAAARVRLLPAGTADPVDLVVIALHFTVALLFLLRAPVRERAPWPFLVLALPSFLGGGAAMKLAPPVAAWPAAAGGLFVAGGLLVLGSLGWLGASFAVLPARRALATRGPYRLVRHPAYLGEAVMLAGVAAAAAVHAAWACLALVPAALVCLAGRLLVEERFLARDLAYRAYAARTRWRLVPGVW